MSEDQLKLIDKIIKQRKQIELLTIKLNKLKNEYYEHLAILFSNVDLYNKEKEIEKEENKILSFEEHKKKIFKGIVIDKED